MIDQAEYEHGIHGSVHEVTPLDAAEAALSEALDHEDTACQAHRILLDLTRLDSVGEGAIDVIVEHIAPDDERYTVRLSENVSERLVQRLTEAGLGSRLIAAGSEGVPHHVESRHD